MPRIEPVQLLNCLRVLLDENGGILSTNEVKRLEGLMTKYSKKLVSKCIYVLILKSTKTELLDEFMAAGGWSLVYIWLNDAIRGMNWPLVQEVVELLLLSPVHVDRLKINSAPRLVKGLSKEGGTEGVRILAKRLVDQWLKIVTADTPLEIEEATRLKQLQQQQQQAITITTTNKINEIVPTTTTMVDSSSTENDPLEGAGQNTVNTGNYALTPAQKKANESGLVYKIILRHGNQVLAKVTPTKVGVALSEEQKQQEVERVNEEFIIQADEEEEEEVEQEVVGEEDEENSALDLIEEDVDYVDNKESKESDKPDVIVLKMKSNNTNKESESKRKSSDTTKTSTEEKDKEKSRDKSKSHRSSSSSTSSSHKKSSSSSTSKSKSSSSSTSHRSSSSSDKHRTSSSSSSSVKKDRDDKDKHRHSSSSKGSNSTSSSSSTKNKSSSGIKKSNDSKIESNLVGSTLNKEKSATKQAIEKLGRIPKKVRTLSESETPTSIVIPSKKSSISIEIRRDNEKASTVKTYKSQFRSHGLNEAAPPPPSRKALKKPAATLPNNIPMPIPSLKRASPTRDSPETKKPKIDINNVTVGQTKPGAIKLIPPKKIQTLVETNLFSDALSAATGPKKNVKRKRSTTPGPSSKDGQSSPTSPEATKVAPLKFYQDTLDEKSNKDSDNSATENEENDKNKKNSDSKLNDSLDKDEDDDLPLKKVKEDLEKKIQGEEKASDSASIDEQANAEDEDIQIDIPKKPGPGCGPNGPPGVLIVSRRRGPKKKLKWRPMEELEQVRYFELDETERVNVTKSSFSDMQNRERCNERESINIARRDPNLRDNMEEQTAWRALIEVEDVPDHPNGCQSKQRLIQAEREQTTLRALYFTKALIPDSPAEAELEPHYPHDIPIIPLDDITGNPDAVNNYTNMPWPEPKGSPKHGDSMNAGTGGLMGSGDLFANILGGGNDNPFSSMGSPFNNSNVTNTMPAVQLNIPLNANTNANLMGNNMNNWNVPPVAPPFGPNGPAMMNNQYNTRMPNGPNVNGPNFMGQFGAGVGPGPGPMPPFGNNGPQFVGPNNFNGPNFRGPNGPMNGPMGGPLGPMHNNGPPMGMNGPGNRNNNNNNGNNRNNWTSNGNGPWRSAGSGQNRGGNNNNSGVCKAFMRGHCRLGKSCKYIHPMKNKRI